MESENELNYHLVAALGFQKKIPHKKNLVAMSSDLVPIDTLIRLEAGLHAELSVLHSISAESDLVYLSLIHI